MSNHSADPGKMAGQPPWLPLSALMGSSRRVAGENGDHFVDVNKMACRHEPEHLLVAFNHECKHCRLPIEAFECTACLGLGLAGTSNSKCLPCRGTGIDRWEVAK